MEGLGFRVSGSDIQAIAQALMQKGFPGLGFRAEYLLRFVVAGLLHSTRPIHEFNPWYFITPYTHGQ